MDPYSLLGLERDAQEPAIREAWRKAAKGAHPDTGGDADTFARLQVAYDLLRDPVRRRIFDDTGYDPELADPKDLEGVKLLERLVNDVILDEREPGSFDPVSAMRRSLSDDIVKNRIHILELERHRNRVRQHIDRLGGKSGSDVLGSMLRARSETIADAIRKTERQIEMIEHAYQMLEGYRYELQVELQMAAQVRDEAAE
ncbi:curved DNA-binding protein CbpA [Rhizobium alvei]